MNGLSMRNITPGVMPGQCWSECWMGLWVPSPFRNFPCAPKALPRWSNGHDVALPTRKLEFDSPPRLAALPAQRCLTGVRATSYEAQGGPQQWAPRATPSPPGAPPKKGGTMGRCSLCRRIMVPGWLVGLWPTHQAPFHDRLNCAGHCLRCVEEVEKRHGGT